MNWVTVSVNKGDFVPAWGLCCASGGGEGDQCVSTPEWLGAIRDSPSLSVTVEPSIMAVQRAYDRDASLEPGFGAWPEVQALGFIY